MDTVIEILKAIVPSLMVGIVLGIWNRNQNKRNSEADAKEKNATQKHWDMVRFDYIDKLGYYCTESSEHNAEYNAFYIKPNRPDLIEKFNIPLDEYPRRCINQIKEWKELREKIMQPENVVHERSHEYGSHIIEACEKGIPYKIYGNVQNTGLITNLPANACSN